MAAGQNRHQIVVSARTRDAQNSIRALNTTVSDLVQTTGKVAGGFTAVGTAVSGLAITQLVRDVTAANKEFASWSRAIGVTTGQLQALDFAAKKVSLESGKMADILKDLSEKIGDAFSTGGGEAAEALGMLGLQAKNLVKLAPDKQLLAIANNLDKLSTQSEKVFVMEALASDASLLLPLLKDNAKELKSLTDQAYAYGVALSEFDNNKIKQLSSSFEVFGGIVEGAANRFTAQLSPAIYAVTTELGNQIGTFKLTDKAAATFIDNMITGIGSALDTLHWFNIQLTRVEYGWALIASTSLDSFSKMGTGGQTFINNFLEPYRHLLGGITKLIGMAVKGWGMLTNTDAMVNFGNEIEKFASAMRSSKLEFEGLADIATDAEGLVMALRSELNDLENQALPSDGFVDRARQLIADFEQQARVVADVVDGVGGVADGIKSAVSAQKELNKLTDEYRKEQERKYALGGSYGSALMTGGMEGALTKAGGQLSSSIGSVAGGYMSIMTGSPIVGGFLGEVAGGLVDNAIGSVMDDIFGENIDPVVEELKAMHETIRTEQTILGGKRAEYTAVAQAAVSSLMGGWTPGSRFEDVQQRLLGTSMGQTRGVDIGGGFYDYEDYVAEFDRFVEGVRVFAQATGNADQSIDWLTEAIEEFGHDDIPALVNELITLSAQLKQSTQDFELWAGIITEEGYALQTITDVAEEFGIKIPTTRDEFIAFVQTIDDSTVAGARLKVALTGLTDEIDILNPELEDAAVNTEYATQAISEFDDAMIDISDSLAWASSIVQSEIDSMFNLFVESTETVAESIETVAEVITDVKTYVVDLNRVVDDLLLSDLSTLSPRERLREAKRQYQSLKSAADKGDKGAAEQLGGAAKTYLEEARSMFASGDRYTNIFDTVIGDLRQRGLMSFTETTTRTRPARATTGASGGAGIAADIVPPSITELLEKIKELGEIDPTAATDYLKKLAEVEVKDFTSAGTFIDKLVASDSLNTTNAVDLAAGIAKLSGLTGVDQVTKMINKLVMGSGLKMAGNAESITAIVSSVIAGTAGKLPANQIVKIINSVKGTEGKTLPAQDIGTLIANLKKTNQIKNKDISTIITGLVAANAIENNGIGKLVGGLVRAGGNITNTDITTLVGQLVRAGNKITPVDISDMIGSLISAGDIQTTTDLATIVANLGAAGQLTMNQLATVVANLQVSGQITTGNLDVIIQKIAQIASFNPSSFTSAVNAAAGQLQTTDSDLSGVTPPPPSPPSLIPSTGTFRQSEWELAVYDKAKTGALGFDISGNVAGKSISMNVSHRQLWNNNIIGVLQTALQAAGHATPFETATAKAHGGLGKRMFNWGTSKRAAIDLYGDYVSKADYTYEKGTSFVPFDMQANIHRGEMVIDPKSSEALRKYGIEVSADNPATLAVLTEMAEEIKELRRSVSRQAGAISAGVRS